MSEPRLLVASTGGSGCGYLLRFLYHLLELPGQTHWVATRNFYQVLESEYSEPGPFRDGAGLIRFLTTLYGEPSEIRHEFTLFEQNDLGAPPASGSALYDAMVVLPCSMKTLASAANGLGSNLIERAADVSLKERRKTIFVVRESPYNLVHIENMRTVTLAGGIVLPASPGFYHRPQSVDDIYDFIADRLFVQLGLGKRLLKPWGE